MRTWLADATCASWSLCTTWRYQSRPKRATKSEKTHDADDRQPQTPRIARHPAHSATAAEPAEVTARASDLPSNAQRWTHSAGTARRRFTTDDHHHGDEMDVDGVRSPNTVPIAA